MNAVPPLFGSDLNALLDGLFDGDFSILRLTAALGGIAERFDCPRVRLSMIDAAERQVMFELETQLEKARVVDWQTRRVASISPFHKHIRLLRTRQTQHHSDLMQLLSAGDAALYRQFLDDWTISGIASSKIAQSTGAYWLLSLLGVPKPPSQAARQELDLLGRILWIRLGADRRAENLLTLPGYPKLIQRRFGLTAAEMHALTALLTATDEASAAELASVQVSTLRSHRKALYGKLEVGSKDELRRRIESLGPS